jgi:iron complex transport system substrate-binding protein
MIEAAGGRNIFDDQDYRSGSIEYHEVVEKDPELILLCWCGIPREKIRPEEAAARENWNRIKAVKKGMVHAVEEGWYGRPGPRIVMGIRQMAEWMAGL